MISQWSYQKIKWHSVHIIEYIYKMYTMKLYIQSIHVISVENVDFCSFNLWWLMIDWLGRKY